MKLNPILQISESETTFKLRFLNSVTPFAILKKSGTNLLEKNYQPIVERLGKSKGLNNPYLEDNVNSKILEFLLNTVNEMSINEMITLSNQLNALRISYSTFAGLCLNDLSAKLDLLIIDISSIDKLSDSDIMLAKVNVKKIVFVNRNDGEFIVGPLINNLDTICFNCLFSSVINYKDQIISVERNENKNLLALQIIEFFINQNLFTNFLCNGQIMTKKGVDYKTSYRVPFETTCCKYFAK